jgi:hypothetical protein
MIKKKVTPKEFCDCENPMPLGEYYKAIGAPTYMVMDIMQLRRQGSDDETSLSDPDFGEGGEAQLNEQLEKE